MSRLNIFISRSECYCRMPKHNQGIYIMLMTEATGRGYSCEFIAEQNQQNAAVRLLSLMQLQRGHGCHPCPQRYPLDVWSTIGA